MDISKLDLENYDLWYIPFWQTKTFYLILISLFLLLVGLVVFFIYKNSKKDQTKETIESILIQLNQLEKELSHKNSREFYFKLIRLLKKYIFICYNIDVNDKTDSELIEFLKDMKSSLIFNDETEGIISRATSARFASRELAELQMKQDLKNMINLIESSKNLYSK